MVVWLCSEEELVYLKQVSFFSLCLFLKDEDEALCKQEILLLFRITFLSYLAGDLSICWR